MVNTSIIAGDFNVVFPDSYNYTQNQKDRLGGGNPTAYTALINLSTGGQNDDTTTIIGGSAFEGQRVIQLCFPYTTQHTRPGQSNYLPLDLTSLNNIQFMNHYHWIDGLKELAQRQGFSWTDLKNNYKNRINQAFYSPTVNNDTSYYRANNYDNIFVRTPAANNVRARFVDVLSELGSWNTLPQAIRNPRPPTFNPNPWPAALGTLNPAAQALLAQKFPPNRSNNNVNISLNGVDYVVSRTLNDAESTAVLFRRYISDHFPVFVEVQI